MTRPRAKLPSKQATGITWLLQALRGWQISLLKCSEDQSDGDRAGVAWTVICSGGQQVRLKFWCFRSWVPGESAADMTSPGLHPLPLLDSASQTALDWSSSSHLTCVGQFLRQDGWYELEWLKGRRLAEPLQHNRLHVRFLRQFLVIHIRIRHTVAQYVMSLFILDDFRYHPFLF